MKKTSLLAVVVALINLVAVLVLPMFAIRFLGINIYSFTTMKLLDFDVYLMLLPTVVAVAMLAMAFVDAKQLMVGAGAVALMVNIVLLAMKTNLVLGGDVENVIELIKMLANRCGADSNMTLDDMRLLLEPLLKPGVGFYISVTSSLIYMVFGFVDMGSGSSGSKQKPASRNVEF